MKDNKLIAKNEMYRVIGELYDNYRLPEFNISDKEINIFLDVTSKAFPSEKQKEDYIIAINIILRRAYNFAMIENAEYFTIDYLIRGLSDIYVCHVYLDDIKKMQEEITSLCKQSKKKKLVKTKLRK